MLQICFNGVAVLFLLDVDMYLFEFWLPEKVREHMEEFGTPVIRAVDARYLASMKQTMTAVIGTVIWFAVYMTGTWDGHPGAQLLTYLAFPIFIVHDSVQRSRLLGESLGRVFGFSCLAFLFAQFFILFNLEPVVDPRSVPRPTESVVAGSASCLPLCVSELVRRDDVACGVVACVCLAHCRRVLVPTGSVVHFIEYQNEVGKFGYPPSGPPWEGGTR